MWATSAKFSTPIKRNATVQQKAGHGIGLDRYSNWGQDQGWTDCESSNTWSNTSDGIVNDSKSTTNIAPVPAAVRSSSSPVLVPEAFGLGHPDNEDIAVQLRAADAIHISKTLGTFSDELDDLEMPSGHYYLILDDVNHALAMIAYIARRSTRTVCGLASGQSIEEIRRILTKVSNRTICLRSHKNCYKIPGPSADDHFVCWGLPKNVRHWVSNLKNLGPITHICLILSSKQHKQMVQEQPVSTSHVEQHPLSERLNNSLRKPIPGHSVKTGAQDKVPDSAQEPPMDGSPSTQPWASTTSGSHQSVSCLLPEGHYHIVLNELLDAIPLISYLALRSTRTVCYLDAESPWNSYVVLLNRVTGIETTYCGETSDAKVKEAMKHFKSKPQGIMLRPAGKRWNVGLRKLVFGCVIYCGVPNSIDELRLKAKHSYLIISQSQSAGLMHRKNFWSSQHPSTNHFNTNKDGSVLHELRLKTGNILENMDNPPISVDRYKAFQSRRQVSARCTHEPSCSVELRSLRNPLLHAPQASENQQDKEANTGSTVVNSTIVKAKGDALSITGSEPLIFTLPLARPLLEGHYCIPLDRSLDAIPLISYLALRSVRTLCFLSTDEYWEAYQVLFNRITGIKTLVCEGKNAKRIALAMKFFKLQASAMILRPADDAWNSDFSESLADCVIYWGIPSKLDKFRRNCIQKSRHSYLLMSRSQFTDPSMQRFSGDCFWPHPSTSLFNDQSQNSVLHDLRLKTGHVLATMTYPPVSVDESKELLSERLSSSRQDSALPSSHVLVQDHPASDDTSNSVQMILDCPLPEGHYCIPIEETLDVVPLISYLALRSTKTLCFLPGGDLWEAYQWLFAQTTGIITMHCNETQEDKIMAAMRLFKSASSAIMLRPANQAWASGFSEALADCVVYWGCLDELEEFKDNCLLKTAHSYVITTHSRIADARIRMRTRYDFLRHPSTNLFNDETQNSVLHELRSRTGAVLAAMCNPPIPVDEYRDLLRSRNGVGQMPVFCSGEGSRTVPEDWDS